MKQAVKKTFNYFENLDPGLLPDLSSKAVPKEQAAEQLYNALCEQARRMGFNPDTEVSMTKKSGDYPEEIDKKDIWVTFEAGPWEWGVAYSLSSHPESYDMFSNPNDWYLECYYGFDVIFTDC